MTHICLLILENLSYRQMGKLLLLFFIVGPRDSFSSEQILMKFGIWLFGWTAKYWLCLRHHNFQKDSQNLTIKIKVKLNV